MQQNFKLRHPVILVIGRLLLRRPWLIFVVGALAVFLIELLEHWHQPVVFDTHFLVELAVYGVGGPLVVWLLLRWLARTLALDLPTKRVQSDASLAERQRIARDLHDKLAQNLAYLHFKLDQLHTSSNASLSEIVSIQDELAHMRQIADEAYEQVRVTLNDLRSDNTTIPVNLQVELQQYAAEVLHRADMAVTVDCFVSDAPICQIAKRTAVNIAQEAINNVAKHAQASRLTIEFAQRQNDTVLTIADNGKGFNLPEAGSRIDHYGLKIMRERAEEIGGQFAITAVPKGGTKVEARFPNTVVSETLLQTCARLECNHLNFCTQALAEQVQTGAMLAATPVHNVASNFGRPNENPSG